MNRIRPRPRLPARPAAALAVAATVLAACATPQEACIAEATRELRTLDRLIAETERTIARGYALDRVETVEPQWLPCRDRPRVITRPDGTQIVVDGEVYYCWRSVAVTKERPRAIDIAAERRILASTRAERARKAREVERAVAACRARYPE